MKLIFCILTFLIFGCSTSFDKKIDRRNLASLDNSADCHQFITQLLSEKSLDEYFLTAKLSIQEKMPQLPESIRKQFEFEVNNLLEEYEELEKLYLSGELNRDEAFSFVNDYEKQRLSLLERIDSFIRSFNVADHTTKIHKHTTPWIAAKNSSNIPILVYGEGDVSNSDFVKWLTSQGSQVQKVIRSKLERISESGHYTNIKVLNSDVHGVKFTTIFELTFSTSSGPRIIFLKDLHGQMIILSQCLKQEGARAQNRASSLAGERAREIFSK